ncbi:MAG: lysophospholipid acyltransferase family protein [Eubacteriales bacterium]|nr:lysophospholipid acyltransferase family protein [Eubacteriales bacterium]
MKYLRHRIVFFLLSPVFDLYMRLSYHYQRAPRSASLKRGAKFILANHNCNLDPFMIAASFNEPIYFVASDHLFRKGWISAIIRFLVAPIPIVKSQIDLRTLRTIRETLAADRVVCLFPEGNRSFSGRTGHISPATGKLVRQLKCPLVLYRIHGGYLSTPRWASKRRKGRMHGEIARILTAEELAGMRPQDIQTIIEETLYVDAYEHQRQLEQPVAFRGPALAEHLERTLFVCPSCHGIDTLHSHDDQFACRCGFSVAIDVYGFFHPLRSKADELAVSDRTFDTVADWDAWQINWLRQSYEQSSSQQSSSQTEEMSNKTATSHTQDSSHLQATPRDPGVKPSEPSPGQRSDKNIDWPLEWLNGSEPIIQDVDQCMTLTSRASHDQSIGCGSLALFSDRLEFKPNPPPSSHSGEPGDIRCFPFSQISRMIVHGSQTLQFSLDDQQTFEIHSAHPRSAYKYTVLFNLLSPNLKKH